MTAPGLLDFFVLEASEYLEQLDGLLAGGTAAPDFEALQRSARGLRGSATMAKLVPFAELAGALERVARGARQGAVQWDRATAGAMVAAVDDLKILLHSARAWSDDETAKARTRTMELLTIVPSGTQPAPATPGATSGVAFLSNETANVAAGLEFLLTAPGGGGEAGVQVLQRVRALRGIAAIKDVPALPDALEGAEQAAAPLEQGRPLTDAQREVLTNAATLLRELAFAVRAGKTVAPQSVATFEQSLDRWLDTEDGTGDPVVPISSLFHGDAGPHVVTATPNPPTTAAQRFRLEMVSNGEHVRLLVEEARTADPQSRERYRRHIRRALRGIRRSAESFGEAGVAGALDFIASELTAVDDATLDRLRIVTRRLAAPFSDPAQLAGLLRDAMTADPAQRTPTMPLRAVEAPAAVARPAAAFATPSPAASAPTPAVATTPVVPLVPVAPVAPVAPAAPAAAAAAAMPIVPAAPAPVATPSHSLAAMLERSASAVAAIGAQPLTPHAATAEAPIVPIGALVYRGKAALRRALELRDELREVGGTPDREAVGELFDLIELALVD